VKNVKTLPGADIVSNHNVLLAKIYTRLKKIKVKKENQDGIWRS
jgi:hypothetical protein